MRKSGTWKKVVLALMVLAACFGFAMAGAEEATAPEMQVTFTDEREVTLYLDGRSSEIWYWNAFVSNQSEMYAYYGTDPVWNVTHISGNEDAYRVVSEGSSDSCYIDIPLSVYACDEAGDVVIGVSLTWGDQSWNETLTLHVVERDFELPTLNYEDVTITLGETVSVDETALQPADWVAPESCIEEGSWWSIDQLTGGSIGGATGDGFLCYDFVPHSAGAYRVTMFYEFANYQISDSFIIFVADESGVVPGLDMQVTGAKQTEQTVYVGGNNLLTAWHLQVSNWQLMRAVQGGDPAWTVTCVSGDENVYDANIRIWDDGDGYVLVTIDNAQLSAGDTVLRAECVWGDQTWSQELTIHVKDVDFTLPTLVCEDKTITMGESLAITREEILQPSGWTLPEEGLQETFGRGYSALVNGTYLSISSNGVLSYTFTPSAPGVYMIDIYYYVANYCFTDSFTLYVADENGVVPSPELDIYVNGGEEATIYLGGTHNCELFYARIRNYSALQEMLGGESSWTVTHVSGSEDVYFYDTYTWADGDGYVRLYANSLEDYSQTGDSVVRVTCTWGDLSWSQDFTIHVAELPGGPPTGLKELDELYIQAGEDVTFAAADLILPEGWAIEGEEESLGWGYDTITGEGWMNLVSNTGDEITFNYTEPGIYRTNLGYECANFYYNTSFIAYVTDENGVVPSPELDIYVNGGEEATIYLGGTHNCELFYARIQNYSALQEMLGGESSWTVTHVSGSEEVYSYNTYTWDNGDGYVRLYANSLEDYSQTGDSVVRVTCTWGDLSWSQDFTIHVAELPGDPPTGLKELDELYIQAGEDVTFAAADLILPEGWALEGEEESLGWGYNTITGEGWMNLVSNTGDEITLKYTEPGIYRTILGYECANFYYNTSFIAYVTDENGEYPQLEMQISGADVTEKTIYLGGSSYCDLWRLSLDNSYEFYQAFGETANVTAVVTSGDEELCDWYTNASQGYTYIDINLNNLSDTVVGDTVIQVCFACGDQVWTENLTVHVAELPANAPTEMAELPDIYVAAATEFSLDVAQMLLPEGWTLEGTVPELEIYRICVVGNGWLNQTRVDGTTYWMEITEPGIYELEAEVTCGNLRFTGSFYAHVSDENGVVPQPELTLRSDEAAEQTFFVGGDAPNQLIRVYIEDYWQLNDYIGQAPVWTMETLAGDSTGITVVKSGRSCAVRMNSRPSVEEDVTLRICCTWGELSACYDLVLHFVEPACGAPTGLNYPDEIVLAPGECYQLLADQVLPEGWTLEEYGVTPYFNYVSAGYDGTLSSEYSDEQATITAQKTGIQLVQIDWNCANYSLSKEIIVYVTDEEGNIPELNVTFYDYGDETELYRGGSRYWELAYCEISNGSLLEKLYGGEPSFTYAFRGVDASAVKVDAWYRDIYFYVDGEGLTESGDLFIDVTCTWGDVSATKTYTVHVLEPAGGVPTGLNIPDKITLGLGESVVFDSAALVLPEGWTLGEARESWLEFNFGNFAYDLVDSDYDYNEETASEIRTLTGVQPGTAPISITWVCANYEITKNVVLAVLNEDGSEEPMYFPVYDIDETYVMYTGGQNPSVTDVWLDATMFDAYQEFYGGVPTWTLTTLSGEHQFEVEMLAENKEEDRPYGLGFIINLTETPVAGTTTFRLDGVWGDVTHSSTHTLVVQDHPCGVPTGIDYPDEVILMVGDIFRIDDQAVLPTDWDVGEDYASMGFANANDSFWNALEYEYWGDTYTEYSFDTPGVYPVTLIWQCANFTLTKDVTFKVTDENGNLPETELVIRSGYDSRNLYVGGSSGICINNYYVDYNIYQQLQSELGGQPTWNVEVVEGSMAYAAWADGNWMDLTIQEELTEEKTVVFRTTCTWGDYSTSHDFTVHVIECPAGVPQDFEVPEEITVMCGETFTLSKVVTDPEGWTLEGETVQINFGCNSSDFWTSLVWGAQTDTTASYAVGTPGIYSLDVVLECANFRIIKPMILKVTDENGELPEMELQVVSGRGESRNMYLGGTSEYLNDFFISFEVADALANMLSGQPVWTVEQVGGDLPLSIGVDCFDSNRNCHVYLQEELTTAGTAVFRATCTWDTLSTYVDFTVNVMECPAGIPVDFDVPSEIYAQVNENIELSKVVTDPEGWALEGEWASIGFNNTSDAFWEALNWMNGTETTEIIKLSTAGVYRLNVVLECANFRVEKPVVLYIADENGVVPEETIDVYFGWDQERTIFLGGTLNTLQSFSIDNSVFDTWVEIYGCLPEWSLEKTGGDLDLYMDCFDNGRYVNVKMRSKPEAVGDTTYTVTLTWGEDVFTYEHVVHVVESPIELPTALTMPSELYLAIGEAFQISTDCVNVEGWPIEGTNCNIGLSGGDSLWQHLNYVNMTDEYREYSLNAAGVYLASVYWECENIYLEQPLMIFVANADGSYPEISMQVHYAQPEEDIAYVGGTSTQVQFLNIDYADFESLTNYYGVSPVWSAELLEGEGEISMHTGDGARYADVYLDNAWNQAGTIKYRVTASIGNTTWSQDFVINVVECSAGIPTELAVPAQITAQVNETFAISKLVSTPEGWTLDGETVSFSYGDASSSFFDAMMYVSSDDENEYWKMTQPGIYSFEIIWDCANFWLTKQIVLYIADENGVVPAPELEISVAFDDARNFYLGGMLDYVNQINIQWESYQQIASQYGTEPVWTLEVLSGDLTLYMRTMNNGRNARIMLDNLPSTTGTTVYRVSMVWEDLTYEQEFAVNVVEAPYALPTGLTMPNYLELDLNECFTFTIDQVEGEGWPLEDEPLRSIAVEGNSDAFYNALVYNAAAEDYMEAYFTEPGIYYGWVAWQCGNVELTKNITFAVRDADGNLPEQTLELEYSNLEATYYRGAVDSIAYVCIPQYLAYQESIGGEPEWSCEVLSGEGYEFEIFDLGDEYFLDMIDGANAPLGDLSVQINVTWGQMSKSLTFLVHVVDAPMGIPEGLQVESDLYTVKMGERFFVPHPTILPEGWAIEGEEPWHSFWVEGNADTFWEEDGHECVVYETGVFDGVFMVGCAGFVLEERITIVVTDENGNIDIDVQQPYPYFVDYVRHGVVGYGMPVAFGVDAATTADASIEIYLNDELQHTTALSGLARYQEYRMLLSDYVPTQAGEYILRVTLTDALGQTGTEMWSVLVNEPAALSIETVEAVQQGNREIRGEVNYSGGVRPADVTLELYSTGDPDTCVRQEKNAFNRNFFELEDGSYYVKATVTDGETTVTGTSPVIVIGGDSGLSISSSFARINRGDTYKLTISGDLSTLESGVWNCDGAVTVDENGYVTAGEGDWGVVFFEFTRTDGTFGVLLCEMEVLDLPRFKLPAAVREIGEDAFAGANVQYLQIPSGVTSIGSRAFADCGELLFVRIPASVTSIAADAFEGTDGWAVVCEHGSTAEQFAIDSGAECYYVD